jgi:hypothetical protein
MGRSGPVWVSCAGWAGSQRRFQMEIDFLISNEFVFCQDFEYLYKEI